MDDHYDSDCELPIPLWKKMYGSTSLQPHRLTYSLPWEPDPTPRYETREFECDGYNVYRICRNTDLGGGIVLAVTASITSNAVKVNCINNSEILRPKIHCRGHTDTLIAACYRPDVLDKDTAGEVRDSLQYLNKTRQQPFSMVLAGDINYPDWDWETKLSNHMRSIRSVEIFWMISASHSM